VNGVEQSSRADVQPQLHHAASRKPIGEFPSSERRRESSVDQHRESICQSFDIVT
jgi:hypothetical protein